MNYYYVLLALKEGCLPVGYDVEAEDRFHAAAVAWRKSGRMGRPLVEPTKEDGILTVDGVIATVVER